jgi:hypothetical protein
MRASTVTSGTRKWRSRSALLAMRAGNVRRMKCSEVLRELHEEPPWRYGKTMCLNNRTKGVDTRGVIKEPNLRVRETTVD